MRSSNAKISRVRALALAVTVGVLGSFAFAGVSTAAAPPTGSACQAADGKISGRGATFQTNAQQLALIPAYTSDVCGPVTNGGTPVNTYDAPFSTSMLLYNYKSAQDAAAASPAGTGSGAGRSAAGCRTEAFGGTDSPYTAAQLTSLNGAAGTIGNCTLALGLNTPFSPTFASLNAGKWVFPNAGDITANVMTVPVAGGDVALGVNLQPTGTCTSGGIPSSVNLTAANASKLLGGEISNWNDASLVADNPQLALCNKTVRRWVRADNSGTSATLKKFLANQSSAPTGDNRATAACAPGTTWTATYNADTGNLWPGVAPNNGGTCTQINGAGGNPLVVQGVQANDGSIGYAELADWKDVDNGFTGILANLEPKDTSLASFVSPQNGTAANCSFSGATLPTGGPNQAVGIGSTQWQYLLGSKSDTTWKGTGYPICAITFDLIYTGLNDGSLANPIAGLTANQRRTLYSYISYVLTPAAQDKLSNAYYAPLPGSFLKNLRLGFQSNY